MLMPLTNNKHISIICPQLETKHKKLQIYAQTMW